MGYGLDGQGSISGRSKNFSLLHRVQTASGAHPASYLINTRDCFIDDKAAGGVMLSTHLLLQGGFTFVDRFTALHFTVTGALPAARRT
jgi:hypothetical protein